MKRGATSRDAHGAHARIGSPSAEPARTKPAQPDGSLLEPGRNCWRIAHAERFRCVQDGEEYFRLVRAAILSARRSVFIVGWDIYADVDLLPGSSDAAEPTRLAQLLDFVVRRNRKLHCYVLIWDYAALYALERDPFSRLKLGWGTHRRVHFRYDAQHPLGASHHQKVVVVDDRIAFSGGLDLTSHRWDTTAHVCDHPLRLGATGQPYTPFHDVQAMMEGPVAASLGELARERWRRSGTRLDARHRLPPVAPAAESAWPAGAEPDLLDVDVAIARTEPQFGRRPPVHECEALYLDAIARARRTIYIENQYFTDMRLAQALASRLREKDGPELIVVGPKACSGWLEQQTMGALRREVLTELVRADEHGRLRLLYALASRASGTCTFVHSKIMVVDDELLRIGSANLSRRSMGMDTECDVAVVAGGDARIARGIRRVRDRLASEHLGTPPDELARRTEHAGNLRAAIDSFAGNEHTLEPVEACEIGLPGADPKQMGPLMRLAADPGEPMLVTRTMDRLLPEIDTANEYGRIAILAMPLCVLGAVCIALVHAGHPGRWIGSGGLKSLIETAPHDSDLVVWALGLSIAGALFFFPLEILVLVVVVTFGPLIGGPMALVASLVAACIGYGAGRWLGVQRVSPLIGRRAYRIWRELPGRGAISVAVLRLVSLFSATSIHLLCGAARVPLGAYFAGTVAAFAPSILVLSILGGLLRRTILHPGPWTAVLTILAAGVLAGLVLRIRRRLLVQRFQAAQRDQRERAVFG